MRHIRALTGSFLSWMLIYTLCLLPGSIRASAKDVRHLAPTILEQEEATELIRDLFSTEYARKKPEDQRALAQRLFRKAGEERSDMIARFVLLQEARDLAIAGKDTDTALRAIDELERNFQVDVHALRREVLASASTSKLTLLQKDRLALWWVRLLEEAVERDDYDEAKAISGDALAVAKKLRDSKITKEIKAASERARRLGAAFAKLESHVKKLLLDSPDDAQANLALGSFYLFEKGDLEIGLPFMVKAPPSPLQDAATTDQSVGSEDASEIEAGDAWYDLARGADKQRKPVYLARAVMWYRLALPSLDGLTRTRLEKRLSGLNLADDKEMKPVRLDELATLCFSKSKRRWAVASLDEFALARKKNTLVVKNINRVTQFAYLIRKVELGGDFVAEIDVRGAIGVGLVSDRSYSYTSQIEAPLRSGSHRIRIERSGGDLQFWVDKREVDPQGRRLSSFSRSGFLFIRIGKKKTCQLGRFVLYAAKVEKPLFRSSKTGTGSEQ